MVRWVQQLQMNVPPTFESQCRRQIILCDGDALCVETNGIVWLGTEQCAMKSGPMRAIISGALRTSVHAGHQCRRPSFASITTVHVVAIGLEGDRRHVSLHAERLVHVHCVWAKLNAGNDFTQSRGFFDNLGTEPALPKSGSHIQSAEARANNSHLHVHPPCVRPFARPLSSEHRQCQWNDYDVKRRRLLGEDLGQAPRLGSLATSGLLLQPD